MSTQFYDLLDVSETADTETIHTAFRKRIKEVHPDINKNGSQTKVRKLKIARDTLTNDKQRNRYDSLGHKRYCELNNYSLFLSSSSTRTPGSNTTTSTSVSTPSQTTSASTTSQTTTNTTSTSSSSSNESSTAHATTSHLSHARNTVNDFRQTTWTAAKTTLQIAHWIVEAWYRSFIALHYGIAALLVATPFAAALATTYPLYIKATSAFILFTVLSYLIIDWKLGLSSYTAILSLATIDITTTHLNPYPTITLYIITVCLLGVAGAITMKYLYETTPLEHITVMDKLAGWDTEKTR